MTRRWVEPALLGLGIVLRLLLPYTFDLHGGADFWNHEHYVRWMMYRPAPPPAFYSIEAFHPPGYYWLAALLLRMGLAEQSLSWLSAISGCARLVLVWLGLRVVFPDRPVVRAVALALAAILPASLQIDGMLNAEALHAFLATAALLLIVLGLRAGETRRWLFALGAGLVIGAAFWVKVSALLLVGELALAAALDALFSAGAPLQRLGRAAPWLWGLLLAAAVASPQALENQRTWHEWFPNSFDTTQSVLLKRTRDVPLLDRRPADFYWAWQPSLFAYPFAPEDKNAQARFWPTLVASTFVDHYGFYFVWPPPTDEKPVQVNFRPMPRAAFWPARISFAGGTILALAVVLAFAGAVVAALRRKEAVWLVALALPCAAVLAQLQFAVSYPFDDYGVIKGAYLQFAAAPLFALTGVAVEWLLRRRQRALAGVLIVAVGMVAGYTLFARGVALLHPL